MMKRASIIFLSMFFITSMGVGIVGLFQIESSLDIFYIGYLSALFTIGLCNLLK